MRRVPDFAPTPPRVFPDLVIGREITERGKSRRGEDKVSICMMWACVGAKGWVAPIVPIGACLAQTLRLLHPPWLPPPALSPASQSFFHLYKFFSNLMQIQSELDCLTSSFQQVTILSLTSQLQSSGLQQRKSFSDEASGCIFTHPYTMKYSAIHQLWLDPSFVMFMWHPLKNESRGLRLLALN